MRQRIGFPVLWQGGGGRSPVLFDRFTGADGDLLSAHTPDVVPAGSAWSIVSGGSSAQIWGNAVCRQGASFTACIDAKVADGKLSAIVTPRAFTATDFDVVYLIYRWANASNFWTLELHSMASLLRIWEVTSGAWIARASCSYSFTSGVSLAALVVLLGNEQRVLVNGVLKLIYSSSVRKTNTILGIFYERHGTPADYSSMDDFKVRV